jgi:hypothetical protein
MAEQNNSGVLLLKETLEASDPKIAGRHQQRVPPHSELAGIFELFVFYGFLFYFFLFF